MWCMMMRKTYVNLNPTQHTHTCKITHSCIPMLPSASSSVERGSDDIVCDVEEDICEPRTTHAYAREDSFM